MWHHVVTEAEPWSDSKLVQLWVKKSGVKKSGVKKSGVKKSGVNS